MVLSHVFVVGSIVVRVFEICVRVVIVVVVIVRLFSCVIDVVSCLLLHCPRTCSGIRSLGAFLCGLVHLVLWVHCACFVCL